MNWSASRGLAALLVLVLGVLTIPVPATAAPPAFAIRDGVSQPVYSYAEAIRERVWVDTGLDADRDGRTDRVVADVIRPAEAARAGIEVPVIMEASPYYGNLGRGNESELKTYDAQDRPLGFPLFYDNYFVPRGYAVVLVDLAGTNRSQGCLDVGGRAEVAAGKAVVDWLNGRAAGYRDGGEQVRADWSSGAVGMIGKSWDGTVANGVAATGVPGLRTIVPIAAISSWYDYFRSDGVAFGYGPYPRQPVNLGRRIESPEAAKRCSAVHRELIEGAPANGDVTPLWTERDYVRDASKVRASVFAVHGLGDLNVKMRHLGQWWEALRVPRKLWLSQTGHVDPFDFRRAEWVHTLHRWFDRWLLGINNGIEREPMASIERAPDQWVQQRSWPVSEKTTLWPQPGAQPGLGTLGTERPEPGSAAAFTDDPGKGSRDWAARPGEPAPERVLYDSGPLSSDLHIAGSSSITVTASPSTPTAHLSAVLVDYGPATIRDYLGPGEGIRTLGTESCWGATRPGDDPCYRNTATTTTAVDLEVISRGWADLANHATLRESGPLEPGRDYRMTFRLSATDHVVPRGHHLALIIAGTDRGFSVSPAEPGTVRVDLSRTSVRIPATTTPRAGSGPPPVVRPDRLPPLPTGTEFR
ncbi:Xaa-Pro dipeptidyl-peptidase [Amycolatopsis aidingensis]|uniref:Xaa-Pro dipeptidyl-peptidase n=1 Tax=Amycolatopsis aidingensis TaxID=2842453 RepID=UPI0038CBF5A4